MKKLHSVSFRIIMFFILGLLVFSSVLFTVVNVQLTNGLRNYVKDSLLTDEKGVEILMKNITDNSKKVSHIVSDNIETGISFTKGHIDPSYVDEICKNATDNLDVDFALVYDDKGRKITNSGEGNLLLQDIIKGPAAPGATGLGASGWGAAAGAAAGAFWEAALDRVKALPSSISTHISRIRPKKTTA